MKKGCRIMIGVAAFFAVTGGWLYRNVGQIAVESEAIVTKYVAVPQYTERHFTGREPQSVDEAYMDSLMSEMLTAYNEIKGTQYDSWTDEQVACTTQGLYTTEEDWRQYLQGKYTEIEKQYAKDETAQRILSEIVSETELLGYNEIDYANMEETVIGQFIYGNGFTSEEELLEGLELSQQDYRNMVYEYTLQSLKMDYVTEAIAKAEGLLPSETELEDAKKEHMDEVLKLGYTAADEYYREELKHWEEEEEAYRQTLTAEAVRNFLYENNHIQ